MSQAPTGVQRLDLGSLQIPAIEGVEVRVQANPDGGVEQVVLVDGESALQLGVFAAPRSEGIWNEVRDEIAEAMAADGVDPARGPGAVRHRADRPGQHPRRARPTCGSWASTGRAGWSAPCSRAAAAADRSREGSLGEVLAGLVVVRDAEARPVREALPLRLPKEMTEQAQEAGGHAGATGR